MKNLGTRKGITVMSRSDGGITLELAVGERTVSIAMLIQHEGWKGTSLAVFYTGDRNRYLTPPNDDVSSEEIAQTLARLLDDGV
jgi:hypothetical protein